LIEIGSKTAEKNSAQTGMIEIGSKTAEKNSAQTGRHYENNGHLAVNQKQDITKICINILQQK